MSFKKKTVNVPLVSVQTALYTLAAAANRKVYQAGSLRFSEAKMRDLLNSLLTAFNKSIQVDLSIKHGSALDRHFLEIVQDMRYIATLIINTANCDQNFSKAPRELQCPSKMWKEDQNKALFVFNQIKKLVVKLRSAGLHIMKPLSFKELEPNIKKLEKLLSHKVYLENMYEDPPRFKESKVSKTASSSEILLVCDQKNTLELQDKMPPCSFEYFAISNSFVLIKEESSSCFEVQPFNNLVEIKKTNLSTSFKVVVQYEKSTEIEKFIKDTYSFGDESFDISARLVQISQELQTMLNNLENKSAVNIKKAICEYMDQSQKKFHQQQTDLQLSKLLCSDKDVLVSKLKTASSERKEQLLKLLSEL